MSKKAFVRTLDGKAAVFARFAEPDSVYVSVERTEVELSLAEWESLPLWDGAFPTPEMGNLHAGWYVEGYFTTSTAAEWHEFVATAENAKALIALKRSEGFTHFRVLAPAYSSVGERDDLFSIGSVERL